MLKPSDLMSVATAKALSAKELEDIFAKYLPEQTRALRKWMWLTRESYNLFHRNEWDGRAAYLKTGEFPAAAKLAYTGWLRAKRAIAQELSDYLSQLARAWRADANATPLTDECVAALNMNLAMFLHVADKLLADAANDTYEYLWDPRETSTNPVESFYLRVAQRDAVHGQILHVILQRMGAREAAAPEEGTRVDKGGGAHAQAQAPALRADDSPGFWGEGGALASLAEETRARCGTAPSGPAERRGARGAA